jgi:heme A synthase
MIANAVGGMLFVQVILGGLSVILSFPVIYHIVWGVITFVVLVVATVYVAREYGRSSVIFKIGIAAIVDYIIQGILGYFSLNPSLPASIVVHLTNAFVLAVLATYLISYADRLDTMKKIGPSSPVTAGSTTTTTSSP